MTEKDEDFKRFYREKGSTVHMIKGVSKTSMTTKCGVETKQDQRNVGTVWHTRVTCRKCIRLMGPGSPGEVLYVAEDDEIEW